MTSSSRNFAVIGNDAESKGLTAAANDIAASTSEINLPSTILAVKNGTLSSIWVTPNIAKTPLGVTQQYIATGIFSDGTFLNITSSVNWTSSNTAAVIIDSSGLATPIAAGSSNIKASFNNITSQAVFLTVSSAILDSISVTSTTGFSNPLGVQTQLIATGNFSDGTRQDLTSQVTWSSSSTNVATVSNIRGSNGLLTPVSVGTTNITVTLGSTSSAAVIQTIIDTRLLSIAVTPTAATTPLGVTQQYRAMGTYSDGSVLDITLNATWVSTNTNIATIGNATNNSGLVIPVAVGSTTIIATLGSDVSPGVNTLTVSSARLKSIIIASTNGYSSALDVPTQFVATGVYTDGSTQDITSQVTWSSSSISVATISNAEGSGGMLIPASVGSTRIIAAKSNIISNVAYFTVTTATLSSIAITSDSGCMPLGQTLHYTAIGTYLNDYSCNYSFNCNLVIK